MNTTNYLCYLNISIKRFVVGIFYQLKMYWDYSSEGVLLLEYLAKLFHPDKFADLDMKKEIKEYYSKFYNYNLTDDEAGRILNHLPPA